uniref:RNase H type-1 domain-containing protein n=1 Tax=Cannabis sativa TaxID=3483 RepID=A0A803QAU7_CANSA
MAEEKWAPVEVVKSARLVLDHWKIANFESSHANFVTGDVIGSNLWRKPDHFTVKVNVNDTIFKVQRKFVFGCVARDSHGKLIEAVSGSRWGCVLPEIAEVIGIMEALS